MKDFPPTPFPDGVECRQQTGFSIEIIKPAIEEGRCETCHKEMSTVIFNVGITHHHLCKSCFEKMLRKFADKDGFMLLHKPEAERRVEGHFDFTNEEEKKNG
ncbi:MAG: hypothetical protein J6Q22_10660 [Prevotella sp.]|nr:hypothetical protein [Prevotella sp.]